MENNTDNQLPPVLEQSADKKLTTAELKACPGCEHYTEDEAKEIIETLYQLAILLFNHNTSGNIDTEEVETILLNQKNAA